MASISTVDGRGRIAPSQISDCTSITGLEAPRTAPAKRRGCSCPAWPRFLGRQVTSREDAGEPRGPSSRPCRLTDRSLGPGSRLRRRPLPGRPGKLGGRRCATATDTSPHGQPLGSVCGRSEDAARLGESERGSGGAGKAPGSGCERTWPPGPKVLDWRPRPESARLFRQQTDSVAGRPGNWRACASRSSWNKLPAEERKDCLALVGRGGKPTRPFVGLDRKARCVLMSAIRLSRGCGDGSLDQPRTKPSIAIARQSRPGWPPQAMRRHVKLVDPAQDRAAVSSRHR